MEILLFAADKSSNPGDWLAGDVISACLDGWPWSAAERSHSQWIIIKSEITQIEADALIAAPFEFAPSGMRRYKLDPTGLAAGDALTHDDLMARLSLR